MKVTPFKAHGNTIPAKPGFLMRAVKSWWNRTLGNFTITTTGSLQISQITPDQINIHGTGSAGEIHPWKVLSATRSTITIVPGWIETRMYYPEFVQTVRYRARPALASGQTSVNISGINNGYVVLRTRWDALTGNAVSPSTWTMLCVGTPLETPLVRSATGTDGQNGIIDIALAKITGGLLDSQMIRSDLVVQSRYNAIYVGTRG